MSGLWVTLVAALGAATSANVDHCTRLTDGVERLACYDAIFLTESPQAEDRHSPAAATEVATARQHVEPSGVAEPDPSAPSKPSTSTRAGDSEQDFGLSGKQLEERNGVNGDRVDAIEAIVTEVLDSRVGKAAYVLDNGQRWRQVDATSRPMFRTGQKIVIRRAALGSFLASAPDAGGAPVRIRRQE